jgi:hypothetical protein
MRCTRRGAKRFSVKAFITSAQFRAQAEKTGRGTAQAADMFLPKERFLALLEMFRDRYDSWRSERFVYSVEVLGKVRFLDKR